MLTILVTVKLCCGVHSANRPPRQITCLFDMDIPRPDNFNETYLYEGKSLRSVARA